MNAHPLPFSAIRRVKDLASGHRVLIGGLYYRVTSVEHVNYGEFPGDIVYLHLVGAGRHRFVVGSTLPCELRP